MNTPNADYVPTEASKRKHRHGMCPKCREDYAWPPEGRFKELWDRFTAAFPNENERIELRSLIARWMDDTSRLVAYTQENGEWVDVRWPWSEET